MESNTCLSRNSNDEDRRVGLIYDERMCKHYALDDEDHPECPGRIRAIWDRLNSSGLAKRCVILNAKDAEDKHLALVHTKSHINLIKNISYRISNSQKKIAAKYNSIYFNEGSSEAAYLAAGSVIEVTEKVAKGELDSAFAIVRPPGHHAERNKPMGFCLHNNVAIATSYILNERSELGIKKILIVDWDVHHGNGTQKMFYKDPRVLFFSVHRFDPENFYPFGHEGSYIMTGKEPGGGYNINVPWDSGRCGDADYVAVWDQILVHVAKEFNPDLIMVSAGFDAGKIVMVLEGGYNLNSTANSVHACVEVLLQGKPIAGSLEAVPFESTCRVINEVRQELSTYWPSLAEKLPDSVTKRTSPNEVESHHAGFLPDTGIPSDSSGLLQVKKELVSKKRKASSDAPIEVLESPSFDDRSYYGINPDNLASLLKVEPKLPHNLLQFLAANGPEKQGAELDSAKSLIQNLSAQNQELKRALTAASGDRDKWKIKSDSLLRDVKQRIDESVTLKAELSRQEMELQTHKEKEKELCGELQQSHAATRLIERELATVRDELSAVLDYPVEKIRRPGSPLEKEADPKKKKTVDACTDRPNTNFVVQDQSMFGLDKLEIERLLKIDPPLPRSLVHFAAAKCPKLPESPSDGVNRAANAVIRAWTTTLENQCKDADQAFATASLLTSQAATATQYVIMHMERIVRENKESRKAAYSLKIENSNLKKKLTEAETHRDNQNAAIEKYKSDVESLKSSLEEKQKDMEKLQSSFNQQESELGALKKEKDRLIQELDDVRKDRDSLDKKLSDIEADPYYDLEAVGDYLYVKAIAAIIRVAKMEKNEPSVEFCVKHMKDYMYDRVINAAFDQSFLDLESVFEIDMSWWPSYEQLVLPEEQPASSEEDLPEAFHSKCLIQFPPVFVEELLNADT